MPPPGKGEWLAYCAARKRSVTSIRSANPACRLQRILQGKRQNLFATIQAFPKMWGCYLLLDKVWMREFDDLKTIRDPNHMFPLILFINAHSKIRVAFELALSCCLGEARAVLRDAIESAAHGRLIARDPGLLKVWLDKDQGKAEAEAFKRAFERNKKAKLFDGLDELHHFYSQFSEFGAHATVSSLSERFVASKTPTTVEWKLNYFMLEPKRLAMSAFSLLLACDLIEKAFFALFEDRLRFDTDLARMRGEFEQRKELARRDIISQCKIPPPTTRP